MENHDFYPLHYMQRLDPAQVEDAEFWARIYSGSISPGDNPMEPTSDILYPIINELDRIKLFSSEDDKALNTTTGSTGNNTTRTGIRENSVVAVMGATFYWRDVMKNALPSGKLGLVVVMENPCTVAFTYQIKYVFMVSHSLSAKSFDEISNFYMFISPSSSQWTKNPIFGTR
jgi:hypothetical protein